MIFFVTFLVVGVEIAIASLTHKTLLDSISILIVVPRRMMKIFGLTPVIFMTLSAEIGHLSVCITPPLHVLLVILEIASTSRWPFLSDRGPTAA